MSNETPKSSMSRRNFVRTGAAAGLGTTALAALGTKEAEAQQGWDLTADVLIAGAGISGLSAAIEARDRGATVIIVEENFDCGGHGLVSGGNVNLGGGTTRQRANGVMDDNADKVFETWTEPQGLETRFTDRDLTRVFADLSAETFEWMVANGVAFENTVAGADSRNGPTMQWPVRSELLTAVPTRRGSGLARALEKSARAKGTQILLLHKMTDLIQDGNSGRVLGMTVTNQGRTLRVRGTRGVILATGGHTSNVNFRRMFDPRLTEEYRTAGQPYTSQNADGEIAAMKLGAAIWGTASQSMEDGNWIAKTTHIGCEWGYNSLWWPPDSPIFDKVRASGLTDVNWQNLILVKQTGVRFWNEVDAGHDFFAAALSWSGDPNKLNGGGPIWAIFDADAVQRQEWVPSGTNVDPNGFFYSGSTLSELAGRIRNPAQTLRMSGDVLTQTVARYNSFVDSGTDADFGKPTPRYKIQTPPFYAAWATPILHDSLCGLRVDTRCRVQRIDGSVISGLYACGETMGGFPQHGLGRCSLFGRVAGRDAATSTQ